MGKLENKITIEQIMEIAGRDKWYSLVINPFSYARVGACISLISIYLTDIYILKLSGVFIITAIFLYFISSFLCWSRLGDNWKMMFRVGINDREFYVVKDGARRIRVYYSDNNIIFHDISNDSVHDETLVHWLKTAKPLMETPNFEFIA